MSGERKDEGANLGAKDVRMMRSCVENAHSDCVPDGWKHNVCEVSLHSCQFECCQPSVNDLETDGPGCEDSNFDVDSSGEAAVPNLDALLVRPSRTEVVAHMITHLSLRDWCTYCIRGKSRSKQHVRQKSSYKEMSTVVIDCRHMRD